jgi:hypothetical protein
MVQIGALDETAAPSFLFVGSIGIYTTSQA